jgi:hypothetical protein
MVAIADFVLLGSSVIFIKGLRRRVGIVWVDTVAVFIDWNEFLRFDARQGEHGSKEILRATNNCRGRPKLFR